MKTEQEVQADKDHALYMAHSPTYINATQRWGRMLPSSLVLQDHGFTEADYINDPHCPSAPEKILPWRLDAALLFAWLGY